MDGCKPEIGDWVHDILTGPGQINAILPTGELRVQFGTGTMQYTAEGVQGAVRRLYWEDPVIVIPLRREALGPVVRELAQIVRLDRTKRTP